MKNLTEEEQKLRYQVPYVIWANFDIEEAYIVKPLISWDEKMLTKFERIQNGNIQQYIAYGLVFLVLAIIGLIFWGGLN